MRVVPRLVVAVERWSEDMMAAYEQEHHLTPNGWVSGNRCYVGQVEEPKKEAPPDRVETWTEHTEQASPLGQKHTNWKLSWKSEFVRDERRGALATNFHVRGEESEVITGDDMSLLNGDKARENRRRRARTKMRVKGRALREALERKRLDQQQPGTS